MGKVSASLAVLSSLSSVMDSLLLLISLVVSILTLPGDQNSPGQGDESQLNWFDFNVIFLDTKEKGGP